MDRGTGDWLPAVRADDRMGALWAVALHTGLRRGELAGLRWVDVDLREGTLTVAQQRTTANYKVVVSTPKAKSHRQLLLAPHTVSALERHRKQQRLERVALGPAWKAQEQLGHSGIDVTLDVYSHVPQAVRRDSASKIAALFESTG